MHGRTSACYESGVDQPAAPVADHTPSVEPRPSRYAERKAEIGRCTRCHRKGLPDDASMCPRCLKRHRKRNREGVAELRARRRAAGLCAYCETKSVTYRCPVHRIAHDQVSSEWSKTRSSAQPGADQWRRDNDGWARFRGKGRRGAPGAAANDEQDLSSAKATMERGAAALRYARSPEVQALPRIQKKGAMAEAVAILELAARFLDDITMRNGGSE